jgi:hypothetical protein
MPFLALVLGRRRNIQWVRGVIGTGDRMEPVRDGGPSVQTTRSRDLGALVLVLGVFVVLLVVSIAIGSPAVR